MDVAWNQVKVNGLPREEKQRLLSEVEILKELDHKNIIKLYHSWIVTEKDEISVNFITEACAQTLKKYAAKLKTNLDLRAVKSWSRQILRGLDYLHSHEPPIVHRDLKCDNIFVNQNQGEVKIGDLGLAAALENQRTKSVIGTPEFMAPELYDEDYDERVDIYSFGMCIIELVTHECPYSECSNPAQIYKRVVGGVKPEALDKIIDADLRSFILKCISPIEKRLTAKELMNDPFLDKTIKPKVVEKVMRPTVEEEPEVERPGGTAKYAKVAEKKEKATGEGDGERQSRSDSRRESAAEGEYSPAADSGVSNAGYDASARGDAEGIGSRVGSEKGEFTSFAAAAAEGASTHGGSDAGSKAGSESTSPTNPQTTVARTSGVESPGFGESETSGGASASASGREWRSFGGGSASENPSPSGNRNELPPDAGEASEGISRAKSRLGLSSNPASRDNLAAMAESSGLEASGDAAGEPRHKKGGSLDFNFRVKGRILEDKTLRLRLKIGDASGHTRTVEFPFNTDTDSSYSVASEMVDELQLAQSDIRTIMNEIENEVKFLDEGKKIEEGEKAASAQTQPSSETQAFAQKTRASAVDLGGYSSGDGAPGSAAGDRPGGSRPMTRSRSQQKAVAHPPSPPRAESPAPSAPPSAPPAPPALPAQPQPASVSPYPTTYPTEATEIPPPPPPAVIEAAVEAALARDAAADAARAATTAGGGAESPAGGRRSPPAAAAPAAHGQWTQPPMASGAHAVSLLEQQMAHARVSFHGHPPPTQTHPPRQPQWQRGAPSSTASSVISEDPTLSPVDDEDADEEREMEQLVAFQQREAADLARRHNLQMLEKREAMTRRKLERRLLLGGATGTGSASSTSSLGDGPSSGGGQKSAYDRGYAAQRSVGQGGTEVSSVAPNAAAAQGRPPVGKPPAYQNAGPPPPGSTPPTSPAFNQNPRTAARVREFAGFQPPPPQQQQQQQQQHQPQQPQQQQQPQPQQPPQQQQNLAGFQPYGSQAQQMQPSLGHSYLASPQPASHAAHPTFVHANVAAAMSRSASNASVGGQQSSGNNSDDGHVNEKAAKQAKAKEKLMMMEASALLNLDGFSKQPGAGKSAKGEGMKKKDPKPAANGDGAGAGSVGNQRSASAPSAPSAPSGVTLGVQPADRCVKPTAYAGVAALGSNAEGFTSAAPYNGDIPPSAGVASQSPLSQPPPPPLSQPQPPPLSQPSMPPPNGLHQVQLAQQSAAAQHEAQRAAAQQQAQHHQRAMQAQMQQASDAF